MRGEEEWDSDWRYRQHCNSACTSNINKHKSVGASSTANRMKAHIYCFWQRSHCFFFFNSLSFDQIGAPGDKICLNERAFVFAHVFFIEKKRGARTCTPCPPDQNAD